jgi:hypothetical protein
VNACLMDHSIIFQYLGCALSFPFSFVTAFIFHVHTGHPESKDRSEIKEETKKYIYISYIITTDLKYFST